MLHGRASPDEGLAAPSFTSKLNSDTRKVMNTITILSLEYNKYQEIIVGRIEYEFNENVKIFDDTTFQLPS